MQRKNVAAVTVPMPTNLPYDMRVTYDEGKLQQTITHLRKSLAECVRHDWNLEVESVGYDENRYEGDAAYSGAIRTANNKLEGAFNDHLAGSGAFERFLDDVADSLRATFITWSAQHSDNISQHSHEAANLIIESLGDTLRLCGTAGIARPDTAIPGDDPHDAEVDRLLGEQKKVLDLIISTLKPELERTLPTLLERAMREGAVR